MPKRKPQDDTPPAMVEAARLRALLDKIESGELTASDTMHAGIVGALAALEETDSDEADGG